MYNNKCTMYIIPISCVMLIKSYLCFVTDDVKKNFDLKEKSM